MGTWIETKMETALTICFRVVPYMGTWIETGLTSM